MYDFSKMKAGDKFELLVSRDGLRPGTVVEFVNHDCDGDPVFRPVNGGLSFWISAGSEARKIKPVATELDGKWIAWNDIGSEMARSEEEAKRKAERMVRQFNRPAYIAQATNRVAKNEVVWLN